MDEIDLIILRKLLYNCRLTYRELAEITDMSVSAIHKRIKKLEDNGTIHAYIARPSVIALKYLNVIIPFSFQLNFFLRNYFVYL